ncbi:MAG: hypothetical protein M3245_05305 [Actinomycetota bacterium]|nr:hypothetical protein [Actinomycetota bacterium]
MNRTIVVIAAALVAALMLGALPAGAGTEQQPEVVDAAGDANAINTQGNLTQAGHDGPSTTPASIDGADLRAMWFSTVYESSKTRDEEGNITAVSWTPTALRVQARMTGAVLPTFGPSLIMKVPVTIGTCEVWLQGSWIGTNPAPGDQQRADFRKITSTCPGGAATITSPDFTIGIDGNLVTMTYPFSGFTGAVEGLVHPKTEFGPPPSFLNSSRYADVRVQAGTGPIPQVGSVTATAPAIDEASRFTQFALSSDAPAAIDCSVSLDHEECIE